MAGGLLHLRHRLIRMGRIGDEPAVRAVGEQVELIEDGQANQHIIAEHECFFQRIAVEDDRLGDADCILAAIGVFGEVLGSGSTPCLLREAHPVPPHVGRFR